MNTVDILFYLHPDLPDGQRSCIEETISANNGVMHVKFHDVLSHELNVSYDPDAIKAETLLEQIRKWDNNVKMIGL